MIMEAKIAAGGIMAGVTGIVATGNASTIELGWLRPLVELGSFGIIAFAAVYVLIRVAPEFIKHLDKARDAFLAELREERTIRQKHFDAVSHDLHSIDKSIQQLERTVKES
jgi:ABC-type nickel/cobalt efflux system permease component RcnA